MNGRNYLCQNTKPYGNIDNVCDDGYHYGDDHNDNDKEKQEYARNLSQSPSNFNILIWFIASKPFSNVWYKCDALHDLVPLVQFKKREKNLWRNVPFSKVTLLKVTLLHGCFLRF